MQLSVRTNCLLPTHAGYEVGCVNEERLKMAEDMERKVMEGMEVLKWANKVVYPYMQTDFTPIMLSKLYSKASIKYFNYRLHKSKYHICSWA